MIPNCCAICSVAGATMEDETGDMKVNDETTSVAAHFLRYGQLRASQCLNCIWRIDNSLLRVCGVSGTFPVHPDDIIFSRRIGVASVLGVVGVAFHFVF